MERDRSHRSVDGWQSSDTTCEQTAAFTGAKASLCNTTPHHYCLYFFANSIDIFFDIEKEKKKDINEAADTKYS